MKLGLASTKCGSWYPFAIDSTATLSPPTSATIDARSCVVVMTLIAANASVLPSSAIAAASCL